MAINNKKVNITASSDGALGTIDVFSESAIQPHKYRHDGQRFVQ